MGRRACRRCRVDFVLANAQAVEVQQRNLGTSGLPNFRYSQKREHPNIYVARLICDFYEKSLA